MMTYILMLQGPFLPIMAGAGYIIIGVVPEIKLQGQAAHVRMTYQKAVVFGIDLDAQI